MSSESSTHSFEWYILELGYFQANVSFEALYSLLVSNLHREILKRVLSTHNVPARGPSVKQDSFYKICILFQSINCARFETMPGFSPRLTVAAVPYHLLIRGPVGASASEHCGQRHHMCQGHCHHGPDNLTAGWRGDGEEPRAHDGHDGKRVSLAAPGWHLTLPAMKKRNIHSKWSQGITSQL